MIFAARGVLRASVKLWLGSTELHTLAKHLQITSQSSAFEPAEAPQRERRSMRIRLEFREETYLNNFTLVEQVRTALRTPTTTLKWQDESEVNFVERWVIVSESNQPEENAQGTHFQTIEFSVHYFIHNLTTNCLPATIKKHPGGAVRDLGAILKWSEQLDVDHFDDMKDPRRRVLCTVSASGRFQGNTLSTLDAGRDGLLELKNTMTQEISEGIAFQLVYGTSAKKFDKIVRVKKFTADVDQPHHCIEWTLVATFTRFPNENDYAWLDYTITTRETASEGIVGLGLRGRIGASSKIKALAALAELTSGAGSLVPSGYAKMSEEITEHKVQSLDGTAFIEVLFDLEWRDTVTLPCTIKKASDPALDLGVIEKFSDRYQGQLFDEMRPHRKRAGGIVSATGKIFTAATLTLAQKQTQLLEKKAALDALFAGNASLVFSYGASGAAFNKTIRVLDWDCQINRLQNSSGLTVFLEWTLSATYTRFPNESDYAVCEFRKGTRENKTEGTVNLTLSGRIGAPTAEAAHARLAELRTAVIPAGYVNINAEPVESHVSVRSDGSGGDGDTFIELNFNDEYQKTTGDILNQTWRTSHADDVKTGFVITTYSGSVTAKGSTRDAAWLTAQTRAEELGDDKYPFKVFSEITENDRLFQTTDGVFFVTVDFTFRYQRKGTKVYLEVAAERSVDTFGQTTESVSGYIAAPDYASAQSAYLADVRNVAGYTDALLLNERTPTKSQQKIQGVGMADHFDRFAFQFTVFVAKSASETAMEFSVQSQPNLQTLENVSVVSGRVVAFTEALATAFLNAYLGTLSLGNRFGQPVRKANYQQGPKVTGSGKATAFLGLEFTETFMQKLTGLNGILECEVQEQVRYSGKRLVEKPIPDGPSLFQHTGTTPGQRVVTGRVKATTEAACVTWAKKCRTLLLTSAATYEEAPVLATSFRFLPQADGTVRGPGADVVVFETSFTFQEFLPEHPFV